MEFIDLKAQYQRLETRINARIQTVLSHGQFIMGPEVSELEARLADYVGVGYCISCANGTDALQLALMALEIGPGDAVFTTPFTFFATAEAIALVGATPVFVDVDPDTFNICPLRLEAAIDQCNQQDRLQPRAVIAVDLFGLPADFPRISALCQRHGLRLIEDAAQSFGGRIGTQRAGSFGDIATTSFFPAKPLGCYGDGGALFTRDPTLADQIASLRVHGKGKDKYDNERVGLNSRLDTLQAAILLEKLALFPDELNLRQGAALRYQQSLQGIEGVGLPQISPGYESSWAQYTLRLVDRESVQKCLQQAGVPSVVYYPKPLHLQAAFAYLGGKTGDCPVAERLAAEVLSLPMGPYVRPKDQKKIVEALGL